MNWMSLFRTQPQSPQELLNNITAPQITRREFVRAIGMLRFGIGAIIPHRIHQAAKPKPTTQRNLPITAGPAATAMLALATKNPQMNRREFVKLFGALSIATGLPQQAVRNADEIAETTQNIAANIIQFFR